MNKPEQHHRILHVFNDPKFSRDYLSFLRKHNLMPGQHRVFHYRTTADTYPDNGFEIEHARSFFSIIPNLKLLILLFRSDQIIIHCLASPALLVWLIAFPFLGKKAYWVIWGKDLYFFRTLKRKYPHHYLYEFFRKHAIRNIRQVITDNLGDYRLLQRWYHSSPRLFRSFSYPSNLYRPPQAAAEKKNGKAVTILAGNSADPSNEHQDIFQRLQPFASQPITIVTPLSYGDKKHARSVNQLGQNLFGSRFQGLMDLLPLPQYMALLHAVDIAIFAHKRQQAMGNIITLLGMGKKVYLRREVSTWESLSDYGFVLFDLEKLDLSPISEQDRMHNQELAKRIYSEDNLARQWQSIFEST